MKISRRENVILAGDIGGTKANLGLFVSGRMRPVAAVIETFASREAPNLEKIVELFLERNPCRVLSACFGMAGPVVGGRCKATNLPWEVSEARLRRRFQWSHVRLVNDLTATAYAIPMLKKGETVSIHKGSPEKRGALALLAPGTGLGMALLVPHGAGYLPLASEGSHADFAPHNEREVDLWRYLRRRFGHVSIERIVSGPGFLHIYSWLRDAGRHKEPLWLRKALGHEDPAKVITENAFNGRSRLCRKAVDTFVSILGGTAGNLALTGMATGGVYLGGGIPPKILPALRQQTFMSSFGDKGRFSDLMKRIPVRVILNEKAALLGAAHAAFQSDMRPPPPAPGEGMRESKGWIQIAES